MDNVLELAIKVFGSEDKGSFWYYNKLTAGFNGLSPHQVCVQGGEQEVLDVLNKIDEGVY